MVNIVKITALKLLNDDHGATAIEYGLIVSMISVAALITLSGMGITLEEAFRGIAEKLNSQRENIGS